MNTLKSLSNIRVLVDVETCRVNVHITSAKNRLDALHIHGCIVLRIVRFYGVFLHGTCLYRQEST